MKIFLAFFVHFLMALILAVGVVMSVNGSFWLLAIGVIAYIVALTKISLLHH